MQLKQYLLAILGRQRRPRVVPPSKQSWAKAWARRWWSVEAASADDARLLVAHATQGLALANGELELPPEPPGRVLDCGRNARGGPDELPRTSRKESAAPRARA